MRRSSLSSFAVLAFALGLVPCASADPRGVLDLLRPGSHAAVGLGGDPFLSRLEDEVGPWSELRLGDRPGTRAEFETSRPLDLGAGSGFESQRTRWSATGAGKFRSASWTAGVGLEQPRWRGAWAGDPGALSLQGSGAGVAAGIRVGMLPGLSWQVAGMSDSRGTSESRSTLGAGIRYRHASGSAVQASWQRVHRSDDIRSSLYAEPVELSTNLSQEGESIEGRWAAWHGLAFEGAMARTRWLPFEAAVATPRYHVDPSGSSALDQAGVRWSTPRYRALLRWTRVSFDLAGALSWWGQGFGGVDYARAGLDSWLSALEASAGASRTLLEAERVRLDGRARGDIESWPFTSTLVDLLGQRRIFRMEGGADWNRWHLAHDRALGRRARARVGMEWIELRPHGELESWRPAFLVFGKDDQRVDPLDVRRVQLGVLSLGASRAVAGIDLDLGVEQCVLARVRQAGSGSTPEQGTDAGSTAGDAHARASDQGLEHGVGTRLRFTASRHF